MKPRNVLFHFYLVILCSALASAQDKNAAMPDSVVIARDTFWDIGPPFNYYDLIKITKSGDGLSLDQVLVTPHGQACLQPAKVEERFAELHKTMAELLDGRNPCTIPERDLHREQKRCKKCLVFSGVNLTMQASCGGRDRQLNMSILDRDIYGNHTITPENTSWSMRILSTLNKDLGPGSEAQPIFQIGVAKHHDVLKTPLVNAILDGRYDNLFGKDSDISKIVLEAEQPSLPPPSVSIETVFPASPITPEIPHYPPIAVAARVDGLVEASFKVNAEGKVQNLVFLNATRLEMLQSAVSEAMSKWNFPKTVWGQSGKAAIRFALNCHGSSQ